MQPGFWNSRRVLITGHTGFKGAWLIKLLRRLGAELFGIALPPAIEPNAFTAMRCEDDIASTIADIRDLGALHDTVAAFQPEAVFHLAAQSLVKQSYVDPVGTYSTNVMGTVHILEIARRIESIRAVVNVTSDKCYENRSLDRGYKESDPLGGHDPYSSSKGCAEIVTSAYLRSYFNAGSSGHAAIASARAGNVIGGGDWASDRLIPDLVRGARERRPVLIRSPVATRPWQHVLEPLSGYVQLGEALVKRGAEVAGAWNFGPEADGDQQVSWIADRFCAAWGRGSSWRVDDRPHPHEAQLLKLDSSKARERLHWRSRWSVDEALAASIDWYKAYYAGQNMNEFTIAQIESYLGRFAR